MLRPGHKKTPPRRAAGRDRRECFLRAGRRPGGNRNAPARECGDEGGRGRPLFCGVSGVRRNISRRTPEPPSRGELSHALPLPPAQPPAAPRRLGGRRGGTDGNAALCAPRQRRHAGAGPGRESGAACGQRARDARDAKRRPGGRRVTMQSGKAKASAGRGAARDGVGLGCPARGGVSRGCAYGRPAPAAAGSLRATPAPPAHTSWPRRAALFSPRRTPRTSHSRRPRACAARGSTR